MREKSKKPKFRRPRLSRYRYMPKNKPMIITISLGNNAPTHWIYQTVLIRLKSLLDTCHRLIKTFVYVFLCFSFHRTFHVYYMRNQHQYDFSLSSNVIFVFKVIHILEIQYVFLKLLASVMTDCI
jgi:hypothetical protein